MARGADFEFRLAYSSRKTIQVVLSALAPSLLHAPSLSNQVNKRQEALESSRYSRGSLSGHQALGISGPFWIYVERFRHYCHPLVLTKLRIGVCWSRTPTTEPGCHWRQVTRSPCPCAVAAVSQLAALLHNPPQARTPQNRTTQEGSLATDTLSAYDRLRVMSHKERSCSILGPNQSRISPHTSVYEDNLTQVTRGFKKFDFLEMSNVDVLSPLASKLEEHGPLVVPCS